MKHSKADSLALARAETMPETQISEHRSLHADHAVLQLQRTRGNRHVQRIVNQRRATSGAMPVVQPKLVLGAPNDKYEREADRVAQQVTTGSAQQKADVVQPMSVAHGTVITSDVQHDIQQARGGGQALPKSVCEPMEQALGTDFNGVRLHTDAQADALNQSLQARAFTTGQDIFFRRGDYDPGSRGGRELIAHELTHVVQQGGADTVVQRAILPIKTGDANADQTIDTGVRLLDEGKLNQRTGKIEANARGQILAVNAYDELQNITDMTEPIYIVGHSEGRTIAGKDAIEVAALLNQYLPAGYTGKIKFIACHSAQHEHTWGTGADQLRNKPNDQFTETDKGRIKKYNLAVYKGQTPPRLPDELQPLMTTFAQTVAILLYRSRHASGVMPASVQGYLDTGSLLADPRGHAVGVEQSARMLIKTPEARKRIVEEYDEWEKDVYKPAEKALQERQRYVAPKEKKSKLKAFTTKIGLTKPDAPAPTPNWAKTKDEKWFGRMPDEVKSALDPHASPNRNDYVQAVTELEKAAIKKNTSLLRQHGKFGADAKKVYAVDATGSDIAKRNVRSRKVGKTLVRPGTTATTPAPVIAPSNVSADVVEIASEDENNDWREYMMLRQANDDI